MAPSPFGRERDDPRPPIEVLGPPGEPPGRVTVGGPGKGRRNAILAAVLAIVALAGGLALGDLDDDQAAPRPTTTSSTRRREANSRTTTTAPPVTLPTGPVLPAPTGASVLLTRGLGSWVHLDLDTGTRTLVERPGVDPYAVVGVRGGIVTTNDGMGVFVPMPSGEAVELGPAMQVYATSDPEVVWLLEGAEERGALPEGLPWRAHVVEARTGRSRGSAVDLRSGYVDGASDAGLVASSGGRVYLLRPDGRVEPVAAGTVLGVGGRYVVLYTCDDDARCEEVILDLVDGSRRPLGLGGTPTDGGRYVVVGVGGELAAMTYGPANPEMNLGQVGRARWDVVETQLELPGNPVALPGGQGWLAMSTTQGGGVVRFAVEGDEVIVDQVVALARDSGDQLVVIPR